MASEIYRKRSERERTPLDKRQISLQDGGVGEFFALQNGQQVIVWTKNRPKTPIVPRFPSRQEQSDNANNVRNEARRKDERPWDPDLMVD